MRRISRREFAALTVAGAAVSGVAMPRARGFDPDARALTAAAVAERIRQAIGGTWEPDGPGEIDSFKIGDPSTVVTGIVTTSMATVDVMRQAVRAGANLIVTATPTFYSRADIGAPGGRGGGPAAGRGAVPARGAGPARGAAPAAPSPAEMSGPGTGASAPMPPGPVLPASVVPPAQRGGGVPAAVAPPDPVYAGKNAFIATHGLVVFRLARHWTERRPDPRAIGLARAMGWTRYASGTDARRYDIPPIALGALASRLKKALGTRGGIRGIGDQAAIVRRVGLLPGYTTIQAAIAMMPTVDVVVTGEVQEWESPAYAQDVAFAGLGKGFISIGRVVNEAPGMQVCAEWLKTLVPDVPVRFIAAGDPYWRPF